VEKKSIDGIMLTKYYCAYIEDYGIAVLSDLHIGYEEVMAQKGLLLPKLQKLRILKILETIFNNLKPEKILIDGDFKHEFSRNMRQEWNEIIEIINYIKERAELIVVRGNHDNYLKNILLRYNIPLHKYIKIGKYVFAHGDKKIDYDGFLIMGHEHPSIKIRDFSGGIITIPSYIFNDKILVLPSPSLYSSGSDILNGEILSPLLIDEKIDDFQAIGIDDRIGLMELGRVGDIRSL
jgi:putative SbcD/Mre11-related phosphoesterase